MRLRGENDETLEVCIAPNDEGVCACALARACTQYARMRSISARLQYTVYRFMYKLFSPHMRELGGALSFNFSCTEKGGGKEYL
jgi:hypothetical protein